MIDSTLKTDVAANESDKFIEKFKSIFQGVWVKKDYITSIEKTHSPYKSQLKLWGVASILIDMKQVKDSVIAGYSLNNHEGSNFTVFFKPVVNSTSLKINLSDYNNKSNYYELGYRIIGSDTSITLYHINKYKVIIDSTRYRRVLNKAIDENNAADGIDFITNKKLFAGKYDLIDIGGHRSTVDFNTNGKVSGFLSFSKYYINTDFVAGPENNLDDVIFDLSSTVSADFAYKFSADTIKLFEVKHNADSTLLKS